MKVHFFAARGQSAATSYAKTKRLSLAGVGRGLVGEMNRINYEVGQDSPSLNARLLNYIGSVKERHPHLAPVVDRARRRVNQRAQHRSSPRS